MVLKNYYEQKKKAIRKALTVENSDGKPLNIELFSDSVFTNSNYKFPVILFKYKNIKWNTSSEQEYKADVEFSVCIILDPSEPSDPEEPSSSNYIEVFDIANQVDQAILLSPTSGELRQNKEDIQTNDTVLPLITNSAFKISEGQYTVKDDFWDKNNFFIWEINYKTTLIESVYKKRYTMISNEFFNQNDIDTDIDEVRKKLSAIGFNLDDYYLQERNGKPLLVLKEVNETINTKINKDKRNDSLDIDGSVTQFLKNE